MLAVTSPLYNSLGSNEKISFLTKNFPERLWGKTDDIVHSYIGSPYELSGVIRAYRETVKENYPNYKPCQ